MIKFGSMRWNKICEYVNDVKRPRTFGETFGWAVDLSFRWWDEPVLIVLQREMQSLKSAGTPYNKGAPLLLLRKAQYDIAKQVGRDVFSVRRSIERLAKMGKNRFVGFPLTI